MVSIIIINYNTYQLTSVCIRSIYKSTLNIEFEIILVDNGSTECSAELFKNEFPEIILIKSDKNLGFAKGNNLGISKARGDIILLLNSDTLLIGNSIGECAIKLTSLPDNFAAISCMLSSPDGAIQKQCSRFPRIFNEFIELTRIHKLLPAWKRAVIMLGSYYDHKSDISPDWFWGTFFMFRKAVLKDIPNAILNEDYFMYCEDMRWCYDFKKAGKKMYYYAKPRIIHVTGGSAANKSDKQTQIITNELDFTVKTRGTFYMLIYGLTRAFNILLSAGRSPMKIASFREYIKDSMKLFSRRM